MSDVEPKFPGDERNDPLPDDDVVYQINTFGADFTVDGLIKRFDRGDIFRPEFQRNFVWTVPQASRFIESILLGLPIPSIFLYREESSQKHLIVDGLQRLTTIHAFSTGHFPNNDQKFRLRDVKEPYNGKTIKDLDDEELRRFEDSVIHAMIIQQLAPNNDNSSVFHIFERLNSYGTPLQPQEMRAAIFHGPFQDKLGELNLFPLWRQYFGSLHKRGKDEELILRFLALYFDRKNYVKPMKKFLNKYMQKNRYLKDISGEQHAELFTRTFERAYSALGKQAFKPKRSLNVSVYDAIMVAIASRPNAKSDVIQKAHENLLKNKEFLKATSDATSDETVVKTRIRLAIEAIDAST